MTHHKKFKVAAYPRLRARISVKFYLMVINTLKMNSVSFFDRATIVKIDPFPYLGPQQGQNMMGLYVVRIPNG